MPNVRGWGVLFIRRRTAASVLQLLGAGCLMVVVLAHFSEAFHLLPWMQWGHPQSVGHYVDLTVSFLVWPCSQSDIWPTPSQSASRMAKRPTKKPDK